jgi:hypothetical protein
MSTVSPSLSKESPSITKPQPITSDQSNRDLVADAAKEVLQNIIDNMDKLDVNSAFEYFSDDPDTNYTENGFLYPSLTALKEDFNKLIASLEFLDQTVNRWNVMVLSNDAAVVTLSTHARIKAKGRPEYEFDYISSSVVQKRNGKWLLVHGHESWLNAAEVIAAITPPAISEK